jgi:hypothetical protein
MEDDRHIYQSAILTVNLLRHYSLAAQEWQHGYLHVLLLAFSTIFRELLQVFSQCIFRTNDAANIKLSGFMLQYLGYFLTDADPVLIYTFRLNDFFFAAKISGRGSRTGCFFSFPLSALLRYDFFCGFFIATSSWGRISNHQNQASL